MPQRTAIPPTTNFALPRLYETVLVKAGRVPLLARHWARLGAGLTAGGWPVPSHFTQAAFKQALVGAAAQAGCSALGRARFSAGPDGEGGIRTAVQCTHISPRALRGPARGLCIGFSRAVWTKETGALATYKVEGVPVYEAARAEAAAMGWDDALICTSAGNVVESGAANLWWAEGARLYTPPLAAGCVGGVARAALLQLLPQKGYSVAEEETNSERLVSADTVFLSNALRGLRPVHTLGDVEYALPFIDVVPINAALYE